MKKRKLRKMETFIKDIQKECEERDRTLYPDIWTPIVIPERDMSVKDVLHKDWLEREAEVSEQKEFVIKDSGARQSFQSGMVRDTQDGKADFTRTLDGPMFDRWAMHLTKGEKKYPDVTPGVPNWTLAAGTEELIRFKKSAFRHFRQWLRGDTDEDHAAAVFFNINGAEYVKEKLAK